MTCGYQGMQFSHAFSKLLERFIFQFLNINHTVDVKRLIFVELSSAVLLCLLLKICVSVVFAVVACLSCCLSHAGIVSKRLNLS